LDLPEGEGQGQNYSIHALSGTLKILFPLNASESGQTQHLVGGDIRWFIEDEVSRSLIPDLK
jgi:hypothetical protein